MEQIQYQLDQYSGPLDLLLDLIHKNKVDILDIPIALICDQYLASIQKMDIKDMDLAGEFIIMASQLMLIKSKMLLPREDEDADDPRHVLVDALLRYQQAKEGAQLLAPRFLVYNRRMEKDTDEISIDTTYVADQSVLSLCTAVRRMIAANESRPKNEKQVFVPLVAKPIVNVDIKIVGILHRMKEKEVTSMRELLSDAVSLNDLIAIFLGILELMKTQTILILEKPDDYCIVHTIDTDFVLNENPPSPDEVRESHRTWKEDEEIPLASRAAMHREQRRIIREQKLEEKKRLRALEREQRKASLSSTIENIPEDDSDLIAESKLAEMLDNQLSEQDEDIMDDLGIDMDKVIEEMAKNGKDLPNG